MDDIDSTSVLGLAAKDLIDLQITVADKIGLSPAARRRVLTGAVRRAGL
jgi:hypothetical protein